MTNKVRGFIDVQLGDETVSVGLPMGAMAYVEAAYNNVPFEDALTFLQNEKVKATDILKFLEIVLMANDIEMTPKRKRAIYLWSPKEATDFITNIIKYGGFTAQDNDEKQELTKRPLVARNAGKRG